MAQKTSSPTSIAALRHPEAHLTLADLQEAVIRFRDARNWKQFHTLKNLALGLAIEASELAECALWKSDAELEALADDAHFRQKVGEEVADVFIFLLYICDDLGLDLIRTTKQKVALNAARYPVATSYGSARKHDS